MPSYIQSSKKALTFVCTPIIWTYKFRQINREILIMSTDFYQKIDHTEIRRHARGAAIDLDPAMRVYRSSPGTATLQVRGPEMLANYRTNGVHGIVANARLGFSELTDLRDAINDVLAEFPDYAKGE